MIDVDLEAVREKATELGVKWHPAMKAATVQQKIDEFLEVNAPTYIAPSVLHETPAQTQARKLREATALIPITVTSMDPADASITAVTVSVGNRKIGQITKVIPFGFKWYMPALLVKEMEQKMFVRNSMIPLPGGTERLNSQWIKKYAIQYHPMPTPQELRDLAKLQLQGNELAK